MSEQSSLLPMWAMDDPIPVCDEPETEGPAESARPEALRLPGAVQPPDGQPPGIHVLSIIGQIEGHLLLPSKNKTTKYEHVLPQLVAVEQDPRIEGLLVILNTVGGDIEAGLAIAEMVGSLSKPTVSLVLGGGHSIGAPIAVAADMSFIAPTATITIHPIRLSGLVIGVPQTYEYLDKMQDRVIQFLVKHSRITEARLREVMFRTGELVRDVGTVLIGRDAVEIGLIDQLGGLHDALRALQRLIAVRRAAPAGHAGAQAVHNGPPRPWRAPGDPFFGRPAGAGRGDNGAVDRHAHGRGDG